MITTWWPKSFGSVKEVLQLKLKKKLNPKEVNIKKEALFHNMHDILNEQMHNVVKVKCFGWCKMWHRRSCNYISGKRNVALLVILSFVFNTVVTQFPEKDQVHCDCC